MYRIWDKKYNEYDVTNCVIVDQSDRIMEIDGRLLMPHNEQDRFVVQQCTGLKDKNGVLIYEGHEVKCNNEIGEIIYGFNVDGNLGFHIKKKYWNFEICSLNKYRLKNIEIIGNIMEDNNET